MNASRRSIVTFAATAIATMFALPLAVAQPAGKAGLAAVSNDGGGVRVVVKPKNIAAGSPWEFEIVMDTHSKPLSEDLTKTAVLVAEGGRRYAPVAWQGDAPSGHHRKGVLRFAAPAEQIKAFEIQIQGVGGVNMRVFKWTMK